ncbi:FecCD family ABC transporter permease [Candidatus Stoquefichus massiliensis]|uniref:FecCD family ABC transporter permease n=1 Tax=Candidatus Stoquefichus massiliensis TaxID=1470350 RepID=UPI0004842BA1|nr:iron ABC transporter permease [Candidatus Stoquefichus massiliensis]
MLKKLSFSKVIIFLLMILLLSIVIATTLGPVRIPMIKALKIIIVQLFGESVMASDWTLIEQNTVLLLRLPRVLLGAIVGASLAICGVAMQALVRNQLADPFILGVSSGASAFATLDMLFGTFAFLGAYRLSLSAFIGAAMTIILVYMLSRIKGKINMTQLLLSGVAISMIMDGITKMITLSAPNALGLHNAEFWMSGSLAGAKWDYLTLPLVTMIICMGVLIANYRTLNVLLLGDQTAGTLGVHVERMQKLLILISSLLAGVTIAVSGSIGFVGLMCPHFARLLVGSDHKKVLPLSAILGAILVIWTDVAARMILAPEELPIGILTAIIGGPIFIILLRKKQLR